MALSRLLKSWAMPPASTPRLSSFWDWRMASSLRRRSERSVSMTRHWSPMIAAWTSRGSVRPSLQSTWYSVGGTKAPCTAGCAAT